jgi:tetratricopeptide (TPR) repeat protein
VLGPKSEALRGNAVAETRLALQQLDHPVSAVARADIQAYTRGLLQAESTLKRAVQASATDSRSLQAIALIQYETQLLGVATESNDVRRLLEIARARRPRDVLFQLDIAATYLRIGDPDAALAIAGKAVGTNTKVGPQAVAIFEDYEIAPARVADSLGESSGVLLALKTVFVAHGLLADYMSLLERSLPEASSDVINEYGDLGEQLHELRRVRETLLRIGPLGRTDAEAIRLAVLARASLADLEFVEAETYARRAVSKEPTRSQLHELLSDCLGRLGRNDEALGSLELALVAAVKGGTSNGQRGRLYRKMGEAYERQGRGDRAYEAYRRAIELVPDDTTTSERLQSITRGHERIPNGS